MALSGNELVTGSGESGTQQQISTAQPVAFCKSRGNGGDSKCTIPGFTGTWRSDGSKRAREIAARGDTPVSKKSNLLRRFGKFELPLHLDPGLRG